MQYFWPSIAGIPWRYCASSVLSIEQERNILVCEDARDGLRPSQRISQTCILYSCFRLSKTQDTDIKLRAISIMYVRMERSGVSLDYCGSEWLNRRVCILETRGGLRSSEGSTIQDSLLNPRIDVCHSTARDQDSMAGRIWQGLTIDGTWKKHCDSWFHVSVFVHPVWMIMRNCQSMCLVR